VVRLENLLEVLSMLGVVLGMLVLVSLSMFLGVIVLLGLGMSPVGMDLVVVLVSSMVEFVVSLGNASVSFGSAGVISRNPVMSYSNLHEFVALSDLTGLKQFTSHFGFVLGDLHVLVGKFLEVFSSSGVSMGGSVEFGGVLLGVDSFVSRLTPEGVLLDSLDNFLGDFVVNLSTAVHSFSLFVHASLMHLFSKFVLGLGGVAEVFGVLVHVLGSNGVFTGPSGFAGSSEVLTSLVEVGYNLLLVVSLHLLHVGFSLLGDLLVLVGNFDMLLRDLGSLLVRDGFLGGDLDMLLGSHSLGNLLVRDRFLGGNFDSSLGGNSHD